MKVPQSRHVLKMHRQCQPSPSSSPLSLRPLMIYLNCKAKQLKEWATRSQSQFSDNLIELGLGKALPAYSSDTLAYTQCTHSRATRCTQKPKHFNILAQISATRFAQLKLELPKSRAKAKGRERERERGRGKLNAQLANVHPSEPQLHLTFRQTAQATGNGLRAS